MKLDPILIEKRAQRRVIGPPGSPVITNRIREYEQRREAYRRGARMPVPIGRAS